MGMIAGGGSGLHGIVVPESSLGLPQKGTSVFIRGHVFLHRPQALYQAWNWPHSCLPLDSHLEFFMQNQLCSASSIGHIAKVSDGMVPCVSCYSGAFFVPAVASRSLGSNSH